MTYYSVSIDHSNLKMCFQIVSDVFLRNRLKVNLLHSGLMFPFHFAHNTISTPRRTATSIPPPTLAAAAAPVGEVVAAVPLPVALPLGLDDPLCACPCGVDSFAFRAAANDGKVLALTPVPFAHVEGGATVPVVKVMSAHYGTGTSA
jgi:hypothetical protein